MRIVRSEKVRRSDGEPALIGLMGSCRVDDPIRTLVGAGSVEQVAFPFNTYTHTVQEAHQYLDYCRGLLKVQPALYQLVFGRNDMRPTTPEFAELVGRLDLLMIEISSLHRLWGCGMEIQQNYFSTNFIRAGGRRYLDWWRALTIGSEQVADIGEALVEDLRTEPDTALQPWEEELLLTTEMHEQSDEAVAEALKRLTGSHPARFMFVSHFNFSADQPLRIRTKMIDVLRNNAEALGFGFFDPSPLVISTGREHALQGGGKDIYHYSDEFTPVMGEALVESAAETLRRLPPKSLQLRLGETASRLNGLPDILVEDPELFADPRLLEGSGWGDRLAEAYARRRVELVPDDLEAALAVARHTHARGLNKSAAACAGMILRADPDNVEARRIREEATAGFGDQDPVAAIQEALDNRDLPSLERVAERVRQTLPTGTPARVLLRQRSEQARADFDAAKASDMPVRACRPAELLAVLDPDRRNDWRAEANVLHREALQKLREAEDASDHPRAIAIAEALREQDLSLPTALRVLARVRIIMGDAESAVAACRAWIGVEPEEPAAHLNLGRAAARIEAFEASARAYFDAIARAGDDDEIIREARQSLRAMVTRLVGLARAAEAEAKDLPAMRDALRIYRLAVDALDDPEQGEAWTSALLHKAAAEVEKSRQDGPDAAAEAMAIYREMSPDQAASG